METTDLVRVRILVELPFWLRVPDDFECTPFEVHDRPLTLNVENAFYRLWLWEIRKDYQTNIYLGPKKTDNPVVEAGLKKGAIWEKCRTVVTVTFYEGKECEWPTLISDQNDMGLKVNIQREMIPLINNYLIEKYRATTYDTAVFELNSWDLPVWHLELEGRGFYSLVLCRYMSFNEIPTITEEGGVPRTWHLIEDPIDDFNNPKVSSFLPYERELLDAYSLKVRGNFKDALRRIVSAFEILLDQTIISERQKKGMAQTEAERLVYGTVRWKDKKSLYKETFGKSLHSILGDLMATYEEARDKRHEIVHKGLVIKPNQKGDMRRLIDFTRFAINTLESDKERGMRRDTLLLKAHATEDYEFFD